MNFTFLVCDYGIPIYNYVSSIFYRINFNIISILKGLHSDVIYFFKDNSAPYISSYINTELSAPIVWKYSRYTKTFFLYNCIEKDVKRFPILSASLKCNDILLHLDDFLSEIKVESSNSTYPTVQHILELYAYTNGIVLDRTLPWTIIYMDLEANEHEKKAFTENWDF